MLHNLTKVLFIGIAFLLTACGGGGGSNSASTSMVPNTPPPVQTGSISISQSQVIFETEQFGPPPPVQNLAITFNAPSIVFGTLPGETLPDWLLVDISQSSNTQGNLRLEITDTNLDPGEYTTTIRALATNESGSTILDQVDIGVIYTVNPILPIEINVDVVNISLAPVQEPVTREIILTGEGIRWEHFSFNQGVSVSPGSGVIPAEGQVVELTFVPQDLRLNGAPLTVSFRNADAPQSGTSVDIVVDVIDGVFAEPDQLAFSALTGSDEEQSQLIEIDDFDISSGQIIWTSSTDSTWLTVDPVTGTIEAGGAASEVSVNVNPTGLPTGSYNGIVTFTNDVSAQVFNLPVTLIISEPVVVTSRTGVALSTLSSLQETVTVTDGLGQDVPWQAVSNASWLIVPASGAAGESLTITGDPIALADNSLSEGTVTVKSTLAGITNESIIHVGLWNSSEAPTDVVIPLGENFDTRFNFVVADPIRPYVYVLVGGDLRNGNNSAATVNVYNVYTGEQIGNGFTTQILGSSEILVSDDGQFLYVFPPQVSSTRIFERHSLPNFGTSTIFDLPDNFGGGTSYTRVNNIPYIISGRGNVVDPLTGAVLSSLSAFTGFDISSSQNGVGCLTNRFETPPSQVDCFDFLGTGIAGDDIAANRRNSNPIATDVGDLMTSLDGSTVYVLDAGSALALATDDSQTQFFGISNVESLSLAGNGTILTSGPAENFIDAILETHTPEGVLTGSRTIGANIFPPIVFLSSDAQRTILIESDVAEDGEILSLRLVDTP